MFEIIQVDGTGMIDGYYLIDKEIAGGEEFTVASNMDGTIEVETELGKGTTFKIAFPAYEEIQNGAQ